MRREPGTGNREKTNLPGQWFADCDGSPTKDYIIDHKDRDEVHRRAYELCFAQRPAEELYDLASDPGQIHNLADHPEFIEVRDKMRARLQERLTELKDPRARDPAYTGFDPHPYFGGGGGTRK